MKSRHVMTFDSKAPTNIDCQVCGVNYDACYQTDGYTNLCKPCFHDIKDGAKIVGTRLRALFGDNERLATWSLSGDKVVINRAKLAEKYNSYVTL